MNASTYFTPGPNNEPPMFGTKESGAFAWEATPTDGCTSLDIIKGGVPSIMTVYSYVDPDMPEVAALALCEKAAMEWIRSKGYGIDMEPSGKIALVTAPVWRVGAAVSYGTNKNFLPLNNSPDLRAAAIWVYEQIKKG